MERQNPCANSKTTGCKNIVTQRGSIICDVCMDIRKNTSRNKRDHDLDDLLEKNKLNEKKLSEYKLQLNHSFEKIKELEEQLKHTNNKNDINIHLEQENIRLSELLEKSKGKGGDERVKNITFEQTKLDIEKITVENSKLQSHIKQLMEENEKIIKENEELLYELSKRAHKQEQDIKQEPPLIKQPKQDIKQEPPLIKQPKQQNKEPTKQEPKIHSKIKKKG